SLNQITIFIGQDNPQNNTTYQGTIFLDRLRAKSTRTTRIDDSEPEPPHQFSLYQNYPNPFNSATIIRYQLQKPQHVILSVFNLSGQQVARLVDQWQEAGEYQLHFDGEDLSSGIYFYRLEAGDFIAVKKMVVLR
ncbi:MAG: T9SS type A sorting domain-containing protein, partial [candidate division KSB1 bacterium]|nr:T9SS type A sorting domain-containing protein [candidate division KSB1 bacterium]